MTITPYWNYTDEELVAKAENSECSAALILELATRLTGTKQELVAAQTALAHAEMGE